MNYELIILYQLQGFIKQEMERNEFTAAYANSELVFFLVCCVMPPESWKFSPLRFF